jgi:hypothetical protein
MQTSMDSVHTVDLKSAGEKEHGASQPARTLNFLPLHLPGASLLVAKQGLTHERHYDHGPSSLRSA